MIVKQLNDRVKYQANANIKKQFFSKTKNVFIFTVMFGVSNRSVHHYSKSEWS